MRIGVRKTRRVVAAVGVSLLTLLATGTGADAAQLKPFTTFSQVGSGQVLGLKLRLPEAVVGAVNTVVGTVDGVGNTQIGNITNPIDQVVAFTSSLGQKTNTRVGTGLGQAFKGTLDKNLEVVSQALFSKKLPVALANLGGVESVADNLAAIDLPPGPLSIVHAGIMEVEAASKNHPTVAGAMQSSGRTRIVGLTIDLTADIKETLKGVLSPVIGTLDGVEGTEGLLDTLNNGLFNQIEEIAADLGVEVNLNVPSLADLLDRPLLKIGLIETSSSTDAVGVARNALGTSKIVDLNILGSSKDNALVHVDSIESRAFAQINGTAGGAVSDAVHKIVGLSVLDNELSITNNQIKVLGKTIDLPLEEVNKLTEILGGTLGLEIKVLETQETAEANYARSIANTLRISLHPTIAGLNNQLGLDLTTPSAMAEVQGTIKGVPINPLRNPPTTGLADGMYFLAGPALIGMAVLVRKFALAR